MIWRIGTPILYLFARLLGRDNRCEVFSTPGRTSRVQASNHSCVEAVSDTAAKIRGHEARASLLGGQPDTSYQPLGGGYHARQGFPSHPASGGQITNPPKMYRPNSTWTWAFVTVTTIQGAIVLAFEAYVSLSRFTETAAFKISESIARSRLEI